MELFQLIESQRKDQGVLIRITDRREVPHDICKGYYTGTTYFNSDENMNEERLFFEESWRKGKEIRQIMISLRYYQVSPTEYKF